jgi:ribosomal protein L11 methyltransferase
LKNVTADNFWWSVDLEADAEDSAAEEALSTLSDLSGSIGAEMFDDGNKKILRAAFLSNRDISYWLSVLENLLANFPGVRVRSHTKIENQPWSTAHLDAFPPLAIGSGLVVMAPWHKDKMPAGRIPLYIYPSSAFGTGYHESTQIALTLLERFVKKGDAIVDIGTGSGILFIAALKLGAARAAARDFDPTAVSEAFRNLGLNGLPHDACDLRTGDLLNDVADADADILTANILLEPNLRLLSCVKRVLKPSGVVIFSGMTEAERAVFLSAIPRAETDLLAELTIKNWWGCAVKFV